jgi:polysaccharide pyruvyl transferase WcaK-like protein
MEGAALNAVVAAASRALPQARLVIACHDPRIDKSAADRLAALWADRAVDVIDGYDLDALNSLYRDAALVITNRLHALIFAILGDAPALAIEDGTAKVRVVADRFGIPVVLRDTAQSAEASVAAALGFDRQIRNRERAELARRAAGNVDAQMAGKT